MFHWSESVKPVTIAAFERETARLAIDAGAGIVLASLAVEFLRHATSAAELGVALEIKGGLEITGYKLLRVAVP
jgi:hypothetical protein